ncbi:retrovirus-related pol polyprotein from transposon TNT 1-94 [Tanacetum coccineum]
MYKLDLVPLAPKVLNNRDAHIDYIKHSREHAETLREIVEHARALIPLDSDLDSACKIVQQIQEVLVYVRDTCPSLTKHSEKLIVVRPLNKNKKVRFTKPATSSSNTTKQFTWVKFLRSKDEVPEFLIKFLKMIQVCLNATLQNIRTDNGIEFVNQTLRAYYKDVGISHQTSVARTPQQNKVVERRNQTLVEATCTMLIFSKASLFLWAEAVATSCFIQSQSLIRKCHNMNLSITRNPTYLIFMYLVLFVIHNDNEDLEPNYEESSSRYVIPTNVHSVNQPPEHLSKWTKDHPLDNVIDNPSRPISTRHQLQNEALFCYFDAFLSSVEPKNYKEALKESCWIEAMQEELNKFEHLEVWEIIPRPDYVMIITLFHSNFVLTLFSMFISGYIPDSFLLKQDRVSIKKLLCESLMMFIRHHDHFIKTAGSRCSCLYSKYGHGYCYEQIQEVEGITMNKVAMIDFRNKQVVTYFHGHVTAAGGIVFEMEDCSWLYGVYEETAGVINMGLMMVRLMFIDCGSDIDSCSDEDV